MSVKAMTWAFEQPLAGNHKVVLLVLANCHDDERGICFPSVRHLAERAFISERTVIRVLSDLEIGGYLTRQERQDSNGRQMSSIYRLQMSVAVQQHPPLPGGRVTDCQGGGCQSVREEGDNAVTPMNPKKEGRDPDGSLLAAKGNKRDASVVRMKRGTRIPDDFAPSPASLAKAQELGFDHTSLSRELEKFENYWRAKAGQDATKLDWQRTLQNWLITAAERRPHGARREEPAQHTVRSSLDIVNRAIDAELARYSAARPSEEHGEHDPHQLPGRAARIA